jgi:excisionase family DNA binding protein
METFLAPENTSGLLTVASVLNRGGIPESPKLVVDDEIIELNFELARALRLVATELSLGHSVSISSHEPLLTTQDAANFLAVSRPTLIKYLDEYQIPVTLIGRHRRIAMGDLLSLQSQLRVRTRDALVALRRASVEDGEYEDDSSENPLVR